MDYLPTFTIKSTKCRQIIHTWILWDIVDDTPFLFFIFFSVLCGVDNGCVVFFENTTKHLFKVRCRRVDFFLTQTPGIR